MDKSTISGIAVHPHASKLYPHLVLLAQTKSVHHLHPPISPQSTYYILGGTAPFLFKSVNHARLLHKPKFLLFFDNYINSPNYQLLFLKPPRNTSRLAVLTQAVGMPNPISLPLLTIAQKDSKRQYKNSQQSYVLSWACFGIKYAPSTHNSVVNHGKPTTITSNLRWFILPVSGEIEKCLLSSLGPRAQSRLASSESSPACDVAVRHNLHAQPVSTGNWGIQ